MPKQSRNTSGNKSNDNDVIVEETATESVQLQYITNTQLEQHHLLIMLKLGDFRKYQKSSKTQNFEFLMIFDIFENHPI